MADHFRSFVNQTRLSERIWHWHLNCLYRQFWKWKTFSGGGGRRQEWLRVQKFAGDLVRVMTRHGHPWSVSDFSSHYVEPKAIIFRKGRPPPKIRQVLKTREDVPFIFHPNNSNEQAIYHGLMTTEISSLNLEDPRTGCRAGWPTVPGPSTAINPSTGKKKGGRQSRGEPEASRAENDGRTCTRLPGELPVRDLPWSERRNPKPTCSRWIQIRSW